MKPYLFLLLASLLFISCNTQQSKELKDLNLKGKIKTITQNKFEAIEKFGKVEKGERVAHDKSEIFDFFNLNSTAHFSQQGNLEELSVYKRNGKLDAKIISKDSILDVYSSKGKLQMKFVADDIDYPKKVALYDSDGDLMLKIESEYDNNFNPISSRYISNDNEIMLETFSSYDNNNRLISEESKETKKEKSYLRRKTTTIINSSMAYKYNKNQDVNEITATEGEEVIVKTFKYKYDDKQNWISKIEYHNSVPRTITEREIKYYN